MKLINYLKSDAVHSKDIDYIKHLLYKTNIDINETDEKNNSALILSSIYNFIEIVKILLTFENIDINHKNNENKTALIYAYKYNNYEIFNMLIARSNIDDIEKILIKASKYNKVKYINSLCNLPNINLNNKDKEGMTILKYAYDNDNIELFNFLVEKNVNLNYKYMFNETILMIISNQ